MNQAQLDVLIFFAGLVLALGSVLVFDLVVPLRKITRQLTHAARDVDHITDYTMPVRRRDEIGCAQRALNLLFRRLDRSVRTNKNNADIATQRLVAIEALRDGVYMVDAQGRLVYANLAYCVMRGVQHTLPHEVAQDSVLWVDGYAPKIANFLQKEALAQLGKDGFWSGEFTQNMRGGNSKTYEVSLTRLEDGGFIGQERDVSMRKKTESENAELLRLYSNSQKIEAVGRLTGGIAHDFNNMLAVISGNLELIEDELDNMGPGMNFVRAAQRAAHRGAELTQRLLSFSRRQVLSPRLLDANEFLPECVTLVTRAVDDRIRVDYEVQKDVGVVHADPGQLENALLNLVINARDAMPDGGRVSLKAYDVDLDEKLALSNNVQAGPFVVFEVADTGGGIPLDVLSRVCEPFFTTKEAGMGTGLGLSVVYGFARQSGGYVDIESTIKVGTRVRLFFPVAQDVEGLEKERLPQKSVHIPKADVPGALGEVLLVEDDQDLLETTRTRLERMGYSVVCAKDADEALNVLEGRDLPPLLITDVMMPGSMNGVQLATHLCERAPDLKIIFVSARPDAQDMEGSFVPERTTFLAKPYTQEALAEAIAQVGDGS